MRRKPKTTTHSEYASEYQKPGVPIEIASVPESALGSDGAAKPNGKKPRSRNQEVSAPPDFQ